MSILGLRLKVIKKLKRELPGIEVKVIRERKHAILEVSLEGVNARLPMSKTPRDSDVAFRNACDSVCSRLGRPKFQF